MFIYAYIFYTFIHYLDLCLFLCMFYPFRYLIHMLDTYDAKYLKCLTANFPTSFNLTYIGSTQPTIKPLKSFFIWTTLNGDTPKNVLLRNRISVSE